jgi:hypothetical protein
VPKHGHTDYRIVGRGRLRGQCGGSLKRDVGIIDGLEPPTADGDVAGIGVYTLNRCARKRTRSLRCARSRHACGVLSGLLPVSGLLAIKFRVRQMSEFPPRKVS